MFAVARYGTNLLKNHGRADSGVHLLVKPFTYRDLAMRIRAIITAKSCLL